MKISIAIELSDHIPYQVILDTTKSTKEQIEYDYSDKLIDLLEREIPHMNIDNVIFNISNTGEESQCFYNYRNNKACKDCEQNPDNGGNGICMCILGQQDIR